MVLKEATRMYFKILKSRKENVENISNRGEREHFKFLFFISSVDFKSDLRIH
jgi:hypothetical protein